MQGELLRYQLEPDIALVSIHTRDPPDARARSQGPRYRVATKTPVFSVGCNHGQDPTVMRGQVKAINKYLGPPNLVTSGRPVDGRSGGGLFSADGFLVGICNAADPQIDEGLYAAYPAIHHQLDAANLSFVYQARRSHRHWRPARRRPRVCVLRSGSRKPQALRMTRPQRDASRLAARAGTSRPSLPAADTEVIFIVRSRNDPPSQCQVFVLDRPSPDLMDRLHQERQLQANPQTTEMRVPAAEQSVRRYRPNRPSTGQSARMDGRPAAPHASTVSGEGRGPGSG